MDGWIAFVLRLLGLGLDFLSLPVYEHLLLICYLDVWKKGERGKKKKRKKEKGKVKEKKGGRLLYVCE